MAQSLISVFQSTETVFEIPEYWIYRKFLKQPRNIEEYRRKFGGGGDIIRFSGQFSFHFSGFSSNGRVGRQLCQAIGSNVSGSSWTICLIVMILTSVHNGPTTEAGLLSLRIFNSGSPQASKIKESPVELWMLPRGRKSSCLLSPEPFSLDERVLRGGILSPFCCHAYYSVDEKKRIKTIWLCFRAKYFKCVAAAGAVSLVRPSCSLSAGLFQQWWNLSQNIVSLFFCVFFSLRRCSEGISLFQSSSF